MILNGRTLEHSKFPVCSRDPEASSLPPSLPQSWPQPLWCHSSSILRPVYIFPPWSAAPNDRLRKKKAGGSAGDSERERRERELGLGGEKGVEWVGRVTVARQPILGSDSYSTPSCTTTLHKQSFPFSLWHKQHNWELTAAGDREHPHTHTHVQTHTHTHTHTAYVHMFRQRATCAVINKQTDPETFGFPCPCSGMRLGVSSPCIVTPLSSWPENNSRRLKCNVSRQERGRHHVKEPQLNNKRLKKKSVKRHTKAPREGIRLSLI